MVFFTAISELKLKSLINKVQLVLQITNPEANEIIDPHLNFSDSYVKQLSGVWGGHRPQ